MLNVFYLLNAGARELRGLAGAKSLSFSNAGIVMYLNPPQLEKSKSIDTIPKFTE